ncbi:MAG: hypothetical protein QM764_12910 [Chitinophagaceae bacterium]
MTLIKKSVLLVIATCSSITGLLAQKLKWNLVNDGGIEWRLKQGEIHDDHIEMSGKRISAIITYGNDSMRNYKIHRTLVFPMLRTIPNDTHASLKKEYNDDLINSISINDKKITESPRYFYINGYLKSEGDLGNSIYLQREMFPSTEKAAYIERYTLINKGAKNVSVNIPGINFSDTTTAEKSVYGPYVLSCELNGSGEYSLQAGRTYQFEIIFSGRKISDPSYHYSADFEFTKRELMIHDITKSLILETPNDTLNRMFRFAKIRAAESIYDTKGGLVHGPGGGAYYAAVWANDQAEYVDPFFPFLDYAEGIESARNSFRWFANYMNPDFKPIPSSVIAEGTDYWNGAGDRGDQAMISYGASLFVLYTASITDAERLWPLIDWCNQYLQKKKTSDGVIASDADELEGRFPAGKVNLSTNMLAYGAFKFSSRVADILGKKEESEKLMKEAIDLKNACEKYFGGNVQGFDTYRYYAGNDKLRSWICLPLVMGIFDRKEQTIKALFSDKLWTKDGLLSESGSSTFWDRSTLYSFRGVLRAGETETAYKYLSYYSATRLLGNHVPYAIEAWPEGNQRHLSAESGLYCRVITEGLFAIEPLSFNSFTINPKMPKEWKEMSLKHIHAFNSDLDITVKRNGNANIVLIYNSGKLIQKINWNGKDDVTVKIK